MCAARCSQAKSLHRTLGRLSDQFPHVADRLHIGATGIIDESRCIDERGEVLDSASDTLAACGVS
jgi:hypothetical protein